MGWSLAWLVARVGYVGPLYFLALVAWVGWSVVALVLGPWSLAFVLGISCRL